MEDEDENTNYMLTHVVADGNQYVRGDQEEYSFLGYYGVRLTYPLVWSPCDWEGGEQTCDIPVIRDWFPSYERWGC